MPHVSNRQVGELLRTLFAILNSTPVGLQAKDVMKLLEQRVPLTQYERGHSASIDRRFERIVRFSTVDCVKAGWLSKHKGRWTLTDAGKEAYERLTDPEAFYDRAAKLFDGCKGSQLTARGRTNPNGLEAASDATPLTAVTFESAGKQSWLEIEGHLRSMLPHDFRELVASLLQAMGYHVTWVAPSDKDGGADIIALPDPLGMRPPRIKVQVRRQRDPVRTDAVRSFKAGLGDEYVGLFVATGGFTKEAAEEARAQERRRVMLIDPRRLFDLWVEYYGKLTDEAQQRMPLRPIYFLARSA